MARGIPYSPFAIRHSPFAHPDATACVFLVALAVAFPWQLSLLGQLPSSIDFILQYYPNLAFLGSNLKAGELPLWNSHVFSGTPYLADPQSAVLYLVNWPFLRLLDTATAARAIVVAHYAMAAVGDYVYLRVVRLSPGPALLGAALFGLSEYTITQVAGIPLLINLAWIPVVLLLVELSLQRRSFGYALAAAGAMAMQLFNGWPHGLYITGFALLATFLWHAVSSVRERGGLQAVFRPILLMATMAAAWLGLGAALLLPALEFAGQSNYLMDRGLEQAGGEGNVTVLALLGVGGSEGHGAYITALGLLLVLVGALHGRDRRRVILYLLLGGFALLAAFGTKAPLYAILYRWVPGFQAFHTPGRFMVLYLLSASALAGFGAETLLRGIGRRKLLSVAGVGLVLLAPFYYTMSRMFAPAALGLLANNLIHWGEGPYLRPDSAEHIFGSIVVAALFFLALVSRRLSGRAAFSFALVVLLADLFLMRGLSPQYFATPPDFFRASAPALQDTGSDGQGDFRSMGYARNGTLHFLSDFPHNLVPDLSPPNLAMVYGREDVQGYNPLQLRRYAAYVAAINGGPQDYHWALVYNFQSPLLDLLNLRYVALRGDDSRLRNVTIATGLNLEGDGRSLTVRPHPVRATGLQVQSYLGNSQAMKDGQVAARLRVTDTSGGVWSFDLRAGIETAEWAYDRPDVRAQVQHSRAKISMTWNLPSPVHTYVADLTFPRPVDIAEVTLERVQPDIFIVVPEVAAVPERPLQRYEQVATGVTGTKLFRNNLALPRALLVPAAEVVQDPAQALERIQSDSFDPRREVVLEDTLGAQASRLPLGAQASPLPLGAPPSRRPGRQDAGAPGGGASGGGADTDIASQSRIGDVAILAHTNNTVRLRVNALSPGFLLLNEISYPGWNAYIDGQRSTVWRANYLFRAVQVSPGVHEVEFRFEPDSFRLGLALSLTALALLLVIAATHLVKTRRKRKENTR